MDNEEKKPNKYKYRAQNTKLVLNIDLKKNKNPKKSTQPVDSFQNNELATSSETKNSETTNAETTNESYSPLTPTMPNKNQHRENKLLLDNDFKARRYQDNHVPNIDEEEDLDIEEEKEDLEKDTEEKETNEKTTEKQSSSPVNIPDKTPVVQKKEGITFSKILDFIKKNPWILPALIAVILFIFLIFAISMITMEHYQNEQEKEGYMSSVCDFNESTVNLTICGTENTLDMPIEEYVYGATYALTKNGIYSDETKKALMIILKTNALSNGLYDNETKVLNIDDCSIPYANEIPDEEYSKLQNIYTTISDYLYLFDTYKEEIVSLDKKNYLVITNQILNQMEIMSKEAKYDEILNKTYNEEKSNNVSELDPDNSDVKYELYNLATYCTYFNLTENDAYWWPIGSSNETAPNIYGGNPTSTRITSYFGPRAIQGTASNHGAIDIGASCNNNVVIAAKEGKVIKMNDSCSNDGYYKNSCGGGLGNYVAIEHSDGTVTRYGHMYPKSVSVKEGDTVSQGQKLGMVGNSGSSTGCHLHFEVRVNNEKVDPLEYVDPENPRPIASKSISIGDVGDEGGKENVCKALIASGFSKNAVIGIMMNIAAESSFRTNAVEVQSGYTIENIWDVPASKAAGFGLVQWSFGRRINVINYAKEKNMSPTSLKAQLEYFNYELDNSYPVTKKYVTGNYSAYDIGLNFCLDYERPSNKKVTCPNRIKSNVDEYTSYVNNGCK